MKIVVIGGSGLIGSKLVREPRLQGHEVVAASTRSGVDTVTGRGLTEALTGARVVVDVSNAPAHDEEAVLHFFERSGRNLLSAEAALGVEHHVALSVVGTERLLESAYFRGKLIQENSIEASGIPYSILRATQFFEFASRIADAATDGRTIRLSSALLQPVAADDVASALASIALGAPLDDTTELAGPEPMRLDDFVRRFTSASDDSRTVTTDERAPYFGVQLSDRSLMPGGGARIGSIRFADWLSDRTRRA